MKMMISASIICLFVAFAGAYDVPRLTPDNYDEMTNGKTVFLKFFAPGCKHCRAMAPDWLLLAEQWKDHDIGFVGEVDCTAEGQLLCNENGVRGYPTLKYRDPTNLEEYHGSRKFEDLQTFAMDHLKPVCSVNNIDLCNDETKEQLQAYQKLSIADLQEAVKKEEEKLEQAEIKFRDSVTKLQTEYQRMLKEKDETIAKIKASGLTLMKAILSAKVKASKDEL